MPSHKKNSSRSSTTSAPRLSRSSSTRENRTEVIINVYDLLPPGTVASVLWPIGLSLLHTGIVLNDREYAFGAVPHPTEPSRTGVFWTRPRLEPPGGTFRCSILQGFTYLTGNDLDRVLRDISSEFPGKDYNLLSNNCNHFTNRVCKALTHREAPGWINRASRVGALLPCIIPKEMLSPPDGDSLDSGWLDEEEEEIDDDTYGMLESARRSGNATKVRDSDGRVIPASERAPRDRLLG